MQKLSKYKSQYITSFNTKKRKKELRISKRTKHFKLKRKISRRLHREYYKILALRDERKRRIYRKKKRNEKVTTIVISGEFGLGESKYIEQYLDIASMLVDFDSKRLVIDFNACKRVWPSAITLLCSVKQWVELTSSKKHPPTISSTNSKSEKVNSYLAYCGFYDYVHRLKETTTDYYNDNDIVKIEREVDASNIEIREDGIIDLLNRYSSLTKDEIEEFNDVVLTEIFNNVHEHGISNKDNGWWLLVQYHPTHKMISINIADNGIGIRNSLMTGPQREEVFKDISDNPINDGEFIKIACEPNISGAITAPLKSGKFIKRYESGSRRGNGLQRILATCKKIKIPLAILSHNGYLFFDENGKTKLLNSKPNRVFGGTMYHLKIKTT